jgi:hypothetical protein
MQVNVIQTNTPDSFNYILFPEQNPLNKEYLQSQLNNFSSSINDVGKKFMESSRAIYDKINDSNAIRMAKAALRMAKGIWHPNRIVALESLDSIRSAQPIMQRYIMAEPTIRECYFKQRCDGYSDTYVDLEPSKISDDHYDYRRVMDSLIIDSVNEDGEYEWLSRNYGEDLIPGDRELNFEEKTDILSTWDIIKMYVEAGTDPTNIFGGELGG